MKPLGYVLYDGPSSIDGEPIVVILTGLNRASENPKTGSMLQTWILRSDQSPIAALGTGDDRSVCGDCPARDNWCYVTVHQAPHQVWKSWKGGRYRKLRSLELLPDLSDRMLRMGSYGNPSAAPFEIWAALAKKCAGHTGYEHNWRDCDQRFKGILMASCDSVEDWIAASRMGWRTFRSRNAGDPLLTNELTCPASAEAGHRTTCESCRLCDGRGGLSTKSISILAHGARRRSFQV